MYCELCGAIKGNGPKKLNGNNEGQAGGRPMTYDNVFGIMDDLFAETSTGKKQKKEGPKKGATKQKSQLHYTQAEGIRQDTRGLYLVGRTAHAPAHRVRGGAPC